MRTERTEVDERGLRRGPPRWLQALVATLVSALVVGAIWFLFVRGDGPDRVRGLGPATPDPFDGSGRVAAGPDRAELSEDGQLAVLDAGQVTLAVGGELRGVTRPGTNVVDVAWFNGADVLLVAEGPAPTGGLSVLEIDGDVRGTIPLDPVVGFGSGHGISVGPGNKRAAVTVVERPPLAPADQRHIAEVDLETGKVRDLTPPGGVEEHGPTYVDGDTLFFTAGDDAVLQSIASGEQQVVKGQARAVGVIGGEWLVTVDGGRTVAARHVDDRGTLGRSVTLGTLPPGTSPVTVDPAGGRIVVAGSELDAGGNAVTQLRVVPIRRTPPGAG
jgi:hypothetical protein